VLDGDVVAEEACPLGAGVGDQGLGVVEFQSEGLPEEPGDPCLDLLGFGPGTGEAQDVIVRVSCVLQAAISWVRRVPGGDSAPEGFQVPGFCPVPVPARFTQLVFYPVILRVVFPAGSPCVLRDQFLLDEFLCR
jgi:hypothetical protein